MFDRVVSLVPLAVVVQQALVRAQQERPGAAGGVENPQLVDLPGRLALDELTDGLLDDVIHDVGGGVVDAARPFDLRLLLHFGPVGRSQTDDLAQELLVHLAQDLGGEHREFVGGLGVVQSGQDGLEHLVVNGQRFGQGVGPEVKEPRVVFFVGLAVEVAQAGVDVGGAGEGQEAGVVLNAPVLAHAQKDDAVNGALHGEVQLVNRQSRVAQGDVAGQHLAPALDLLQELGVHLAGAALALGILHVAVEGTLEHRLLGKHAVDVVEAVKILVEGEVHDAPYPSLVIGFGTLAAVVDRELLKVGEDAQGQFGAPGVAPQLVGRAYVAFDRDRGLLGLQEELAHPADAEAIVGRTGRPTDLDGVLVDHVLVLLGVALHIAHVPTEDFKERVNELDAHMGFFVVAALVDVQVAGEAFYQPFDLDFGVSVGHGHSASPDDGCRVRVMLDEV